MNDGRKKMWKLFVPIPVESLIIAASLRYMNMSLT